MDEDRDDSKMEDTEGNEDEMKDATDNSMRVEGIIVIAPCAYRGLSPTCAVEMILDASTRFIDMFKIDCCVEELLQVVSTAWEHLLPDGAILSLSYHGRRGSRELVKLSILHIHVQWNLKTRILV